jgi:hypothetical protein
LRSRARRRTDILDSIDAKYLQLSSATTAFFSAHRELEKAADELANEINSSGPNIRERTAHLHAVVSMVFDTRIERRAELVGLRKEVELLSKRFENSKDKIIATLNDNQIAAVTHFMALCAYYFSNAEQDIMSYEHGMYGSLFRILQDIAFAEGLSHDQVELLSDTAYSINWRLKQIERNIDEKWSLVAGAYAIVRLAFQ